MLTFSKVSEGQTDTSRGKLPFWANQRVLWGKGGDKSKKKITQKGGRSGMG